MRASWLEPNAEFEGVGAHEANPRYDPVDEHAEGFAISELDPLLVSTPALTAARTNLIQSLLTTTPRFDGADISHYQYDAGPVDLSRTKAAPADWFATKLTQSTGYLDPTAARSRLAAAQFRCVGLYHWLSSTTDPEQQAAWFLRQSGGLRVGEFAMLDDEESGVTVAKTLGWLEAVEKVVKRPSAVYSGAYVAGGAIWNDPRVREGRYGPRPMILAAYVSEARAKALPGVRANPWHAWQYSSNGPVAGITGRCDMNRCDDWAAFDLACGATHTPAHPDVVPVPVAPPPSPTLEADMEFIITAPDRNPAILDAGYATGISADTLNAARLTVQSVTNGEWDELIATSDAKKAADQARTSSAGNGPVTYTFTGTAKPG